MDTTRVAKRFLLTRSPAPSRRGVLAALTSGLLAASPFALVADETEARKNGKRQRKRKKQARRKQRQDTNQQLPPPPAPVVRPDARCVGSGDTDFGGADNTRLAQTFTALSNGALVRADLTVAKLEDALDDWILRLSPVDDAGEPTNRVLAETFVPDANVPRGASTVVTFAFANPFSVVAGTTYALVLTRGELFLWTARNGDICQGAAFHSPSQTAPFTETDIEFVFRTFVAS
jgi:hypothetical protein